MPVSTTPDKNGVPLVDPLQFKTGGVLLFSAMLLVRCTVTQGIQAIHLVTALGALALLFVLSVKETHSASARLYRLTATLGSGFWVFSMLRFTGFLPWPLGHSATFEIQLQRLYAHLTLTLLVLVPLIVLLSATKVPHRIHAGRPYRSGFTMALLYGAPLAAMWGLALSYAFFSPALVQDLSGLFLLTAAAKACLTGFTEEVCYRGVIQPSAERVFGMWGGIGFQACLYTLFHLFLGPRQIALLPYMAAFLAAGVLFGWVSRRTGGLEWNISINTALHLIIEWGRLG